MCSLIMLCKNDGIYCCCSHQAAAFWCCRTFCSCCGYNWWGGHCLDNICQFMKYIKCCKVCCMPLPLLHMMHIQMPIWLPDVIAAHGTYACNSIAEYALITYICWQCSTCSITHMICPSTISWINSNVQQHITNIVSVCLSWLHALNIMHTACAAPATYVLHMSSTHNMYSYHCTERSASCWWCCNSRLLQHCATVICQSAQIVAMFDAAGSVLPFCELEVSLLVCLCGSAAALLFLFHSTLLVCVCANTACLTQLLCLFCP
jgi:hypothetical protein